MQQSLDLWICFFQSSRGFSKSRVPKSGDSGVSCGRLAGLFNGDPACKPTSAGKDGRGRSQEVRTFSTAYQGGAPPQALL